MSYADFPPYHFFVTVLRHQPDVAHFYAKIWSGRDKDCKLMIDRKQIYTQFLVTPMVFKRKLAYLMEEGLLSLLESPYFYEIEFTNYEDEDPLPEQAKPKKDSKHEKFTPIG